MSAKKWGREKRGKAATIPRPMFSPPPPQSLTGDQSLLPLLPGLKKRVFMKESDASNFFKKRGKRATKSRDELNGETV